MLLTRRSASLLVVGAAVVVTGVSALNNGAARTPPLGWSSWNKLRCKINADVLLAQADAMVSSGMVAAGYTSLNIDDCWPSEHRSQNGELVPDPAKFPNGMKNFSAELAKRGINLGIYTAHGALTCQKYPGSLGHEKQDAALFDSWNVTYVKNDWCWHKNPNTTQHLNAFNAMRDALGALSRPIVHSIHWNYADTAAPGCVLGQSCPIPQTANLWRIGGDIRADWGSILKLIDTDTNLVASAGPGSWNDADMLEVGNGMSVAQDQAHFTMWCMLASPLIAGNDLTTMSADTKRILTNKYALAVSQDPAGKQAQLVSSTPNGIQAWVKHLTSPAGAVAVALLNRNSTSDTATLKFVDFGGAAAYTAFDVWAGTSVGTKTGQISAELAGSSAAFFTLTPTTV